jgi:hypothetical protein
MSFAFTSPARVLSSSGALLFLCLAAACGAWNGSGVVGGDDAGQSSSDSGPGALIDGETSSADGSGDAASTRHDGGASDAATSDASEDEDAPTSEAGALDPSAAPGGNFDLSLWELQEPVGSPGAPTTFLPSQLEGPNGHQDMYVFTDTTDGSLSF